MNALGTAIRIEALKARRSRVPWLTALGFCLAPIMGGVFMFILQDPERAHDMGLLGTKAQLVSANADWPGFLALLAQAVAIGGALLFSLITAWLFGLEYANGTLKELLAVPTPRPAIVLAKLVVLAGCVLALTTIVIALGLGIGAVVLGPEQLSVPVLTSGLARILGSAGLTLLLMPAVAFFACAGRGYLAPLGWTFLTVFLAQVLAAVGHGQWFPWAVPALFAGAAGAEAALLGPSSYLAVVAAALVGVGAVTAWWSYADV